MFKQFRREFGIFALMFAVMITVVPVGLVRGADACDMPEHVHDKSCYEIGTERVFSCDTTGTYVHQHDEFCYDTDGKLICVLPESDGHVHDAGCYDGNGVLVCDLPGVERHQHSDECFASVEMRRLTCGFEEHVHDEDCIVPSELSDGQAAVADTIKADQSFVMTPSVRVSEHGLFECEVVISAVRDAEIAGFDGLLTFEQGGYAVSEWCKLMKTDIADVAEILSFDLTLADGKRGLLRFGEMSKSADKGSYNKPCIGYDVMFDGGLKLAAGTEATVRYVVRMNEKCQKYVCSVINDCRLSNTVSVTQETGDPVEACAFCSFGEQYVLPEGVLGVELTQAPSGSNEFVARFRATVDTSADALKDLSRIMLVNHVDGSTADFQMDGIRVEQSTDGRNWDVCDPDAYKLAYDAERNVLECVIDGFAHDGRYRIEYPVRVLTGGFVTETIYLSGFGKQAVSEIYDFGAGAGTVAAGIRGDDRMVKVMTYNVDDVNTPVPEVKFTLYQLADVDADTCAALNELDNQTDVIEYIDANCEWVCVDDGTTDGAGYVRLGAGRDLPVHTLFKLEQTKVPVGFGKGKAMYFYFGGVIKSRPAPYLENFRKEPDVSTLYVPISKPSVVVEKQDAETGVVLPGAELVLYSGRDCNEGTEFRSSVERSDGAYYFGDLDVGKTYYMKERRASAGYAVDNTVYSVRISNQGTAFVKAEDKTGTGSAVAMRDGEVNAYVLTSVLLDDVLPSTGGIGVWPFVGAGIGLIGLALVCVFLTGRRKK